MCDVKVSLTFTFALTTVLPVLFKYCYTYCYSDSRKLWAVMKGGGLALLNLIKPTISLEMPVPSQGHSGFYSFPVVDWFVCLYTYEFWLSLCTIDRSSVIVLLPLFILNFLFWLPCHTCNSEIRVVKLLMIN